MQQFRRNGGTERRNGGTERSTVDTMSVLIELFCIVFLSIVLYYIGTLILPNVLHRSILPFRISCQPLLCSIESEKVDRFWHSRCLNNHIDLSYMTGTLATSANASSVAKNRTKQIIPLPSIKSSPVDRFYCLRFLYNRIDQTHMIGSFASGANASLVAKIATSCSVNRI